MKARAAAVAALLICAACSSSGRGTAHHDSPVAPDDATISSMLALVPDNAATRDAPTTVNLYWKAARSGHIAVPPAAASTQALDSYLASLSQPPLGMVGSTLATQLVQYGRRAQQLSGFDAANISADIEAPAAPREFLAARGTFDRKAVDAAVHKDPKWKSALKTPQYHGTTVYTWLSDNLVDLENGNTGLFTATGGSRRFAFPDNSTFLFARNTADIHGMLHPGDGTLADAPAFAALGRVLDKHGVYSAEFLQPRTVADYLKSVKNAAPQLARSMVGKYALAPYQQAAIGVAAPNGKAQVVLGLANSSHAAAQTNVGKLRAALTSGQDFRLDEPWTSLFHITSITASGTITVAVLQPTQPTAWQHVYDGGLLLHR